MGCSRGMLCLNNLLLFGILLLSLTCSTTANQQIRFFLHENPEISQFFSLVDQSPMLRSAILWKKGSLFVPKNEAINAFIASGRTITNTTLLYHFCNFQMSLSALESERFIGTESIGNSPIWITKTRNGTFLNDAKYITGNFRVFMQNEDSDSAAATIVHIIDSVLDPTVPGISSETSYLHNPDAGKFLERVSAYDVSDHQLASIFRNEVQKQDKMELFKKAGIQTFFIPVDAAFQEHKIRTNGIDDKVISGHIIPNFAIFLRTIEGGEEYDTYEPIVSRTHELEGVRDQQSPPKRFSVVISLEKRSSDGKDIWLVNSDTRQGDERHRKGVVQAEIIRGNIPVKNGVVHLINKPLVLIDSNVFQTFEWYATKPNVKIMKGFMDLLKKFPERDNDGQELRQLLSGRRSGKGVTLFVPSNEAIAKTELLRQNNLTAIAEVMKTHILQETISAEDMMEHSKMRKFPFQIQTTFPGRKLLFSYFLKDRERTIHLEGGGVNATVIQADFGATNGYIHIIDRVLGLPDQTVQEKLRTHPMLQSTYHLWRKVKLDDYLTQGGTMTFFAPSDTAWNNIRAISDGAYQNFFYNYESPKDTLLGVLERHFILNKVYTIEDLAAMSVTMGNKTVSKGMKGSFTVSRFPIETMGLRGYVKVNESRTFLHKKEHPPVSTTSAPVSPHSSNERQKITQRQTTPEDSHYYIYWDRMWAHVIRTNVRCTNGIIHIIDDVLMDNDEVTVAAAPPATILSLTFPLLLATFSSVLSLQLL